MEVLGILNGGLWMNGISLHTRTLPLPSSI